MGKRIIKLAACVFAVSLLVFASCSKHSNSADSESAKALRFETVSASDSTEFCSVKVSLVYPVEGEKACVDSVKKWLEDVLLYNPFDEKGIHLKHSAEMDDIKTIAPYLVSVKMTDVNDEVDREYFRKLKMRYESESEVLLSFQNENITTLLAGAYLFRGGAHGGYSAKAATFDNKTGKQYGWDMISADCDLKPYIVKGLMDYFEVTTQQELNDCLFNESINPIPLPSNVPFFNQDGLVLQYDQYEIASYASGRPYVVINWQECKNVLSQEMLSKINKQ